MMGFYKIWIFYFTIGFEISRLINKNVCSSKFNVLLLISEIAGFNFRLCLN